MGDWCLIESDPGVFTELIEQFGTKGVEVNEFFSLDPEEARQFDTVYGLIFLFDSAKERHRSGPQPIQHSVPDLFFARQMINNACGTQAILNILLNAPEEVELGPMLQNFKSFAMMLDPESRGIAMTNSDELRIAHNSFSRQETFSMDPIRSRKDDELYHFVAYIPFNGHVYELDGIQTAPIDHGPIESTSWTDKALKVLQSRISLYSSSEIRFNLLAMVKDRRIGIQESLDEAVSLLMSFGVIDNTYSSLDDINVSTLEKEARKVFYSARDLTAELEREEEKRLSWKKENERRKHNYIPFFMQLLRELERAGKLQQLLAQASEKYATRMAEHRVRRSKEKPSCRETK
eukprot:gene5935-7314_t